MEVQLQAVPAARLQVSERTAAMYGYTVQRGPYTGSRLAERQYWGAGDVGTKVLGLYELEVQSRIAEIQQLRRKRTLVAVGAGDGYHAVGTARGGLFDNVLAFEAAPGARALLSENLALNGVEGLVEVLGAASAARFADEVTTAGVSAADCVVLIDIEGGEYELLNDSVLAFLAGADVIVEIHDQPVHDMHLDPGPHPEVDLRPEQARLAERACATHELDVLHYGGRDLFPFSELHGLDDNERGLLVSEGRSQLGIWWHLSPRG